MCFGCIIVSGNGWVKYIDRKLLFVMLRKIDFLNLILKIQRELCDKIMEIGFRSGANVWQIWLMNMSKIDICFIFVLKNILLGKSKDFFWLVLIFLKIYPICFLFIFLILVYHRESKFIRKKTFNFNAYWIIIKIITNWACHQSKLVIYLQKFEIH